MLKIIAFPLLLLFLSSCGDETIERRKRRFPVGIVTINPVGNIETNTPVTFTGQCSPEGNNVVITIPNATPSTIPTCDCLSGSFTCDPVTFTSLPKNIVIKGDGTTGGNDEEATLANSKINLDSLGNISINNNTVFTGTCSPNGTGNISITLSSGFIPSTVPNCDCINSTFSCDPINFTAVPQNGTVTAMENEGANGPATDIENITGTNSVNLNMISNLNNNQAYSFTGTCSPNENDVSLSLVGANPNTINGCVCSNGSFTCPSTTLTNLEKQVEITANGIIGGTDTKTVLSNSQIDLNNPGNVSANNNTVFTGTCSPNGTGNISITLSSGFVPSTVPNCDCNNSTFSCDPINFTAVPQNGTVTAMENEGANGPATDTESITGNNSVNLNNPGNISINIPITLSGQCTPNGNDVSVSIAGAVPNSINGCTCSSGTFTCPSTTFTSLPETVTLVATGDLGGSDTETVLSNSQIDLNSIGTISVGVAETFSGTCSPNGTGNISITLESGFVPSTAPNCDCSNGSFSCDPITFTQIPQTPEVTATQNLGANAPQSDTEIGNATGVVDLNPIASIETNTPIVLDGTCSPNGNDVTVSIANAAPNSINGCLCTSGTFTCPSTTFTSLPETVNLVATGALGGTDTETITSNSQIDLNPIGAVEVGNPETFSGTCSPNGTGNISITLESGFIPSSVPNCDCSNGSFSCDPITFTQVPETPEVTATQNLGINAPQSDTEVGTTSGIVDLNPIASIETNTPIVLGGSCSPEGNDITISIADATPNSITGCVCSSGSFTCPSTTFTSLPETVTLVATGDLGGSDTEILASNSQIDLDAIGSVEVGTPEIFSGTCSPNGSGNISITLENGFIPSTVPNCDCSNGSFSCDPITFTQVPQTPEVTATQTVGVNAPQSDTEIGITSALIDLNPVASIETNTPIVLDGTCSPNGNNVTISIANATPNSISGCTCSSGSFTCPSTTFTSLPEIVNLVATGDLGGSDTETVLSNSQIDLDSIGSVEVGNPETFSGTCSPNGTGNISITLENGFMPSTVPNCDCSNGSFSCDPIAFTQVPQTPEVTATQTVGVNAPQSDSETGTTTASLDLNPVASIETNTPIVLEGICSPEGNDVTVSIANATPNTISGCTCSSGTFTCPSTTFTSLPETVNLVATGALGGSDTETVTSNSQIDLNPIGLILVNDPVVFSGTCSPNGTGNISITLENGFMPSTVPNCDCNNGSFTCDPNTFTIVPLTPEVTATQTLGINAPQSDTEIGSSNPTINLNPVTSIETNTPIILDGQCSPSGNDVTVSIANATPNTISGCGCSNGTFTCPSTIFTSLPETVNLVATGDLGGSDTETVSSNSQINLNSIGAVEVGTPETFSGSCSPNGTGNISITLENGFVPSTVPNCDCSNGSFSCDPLTFTQVPETPEVTATQTLGINAPQSDTEIGTTSALVDLSSITSIETNTAIILDGQCSPSGNDVTVSIANATPNSISGCTCSNGTFTCPSTTFTSLPETVTLIATGALGGTDTETVTSNSQIDLNSIGAVEIGVAETFSGTCSPNGTSNISITLESGFMPSTVPNCDCSNGSFSCDPITFTQVPQTPEVTSTQTLGINAPQSDTEIGTTTANLDLNPVTSIETNTPIVLDGTCSPNGNDVTISISGAVPNSINGCTCTSGAFTCPSTTFTSLPETVNLVATGALGGTDTETVLSNSQIDLNSIGAVEVGTPETFSGSCSPNGTGNISITLESGFVPSTAPNCDCSNGLFSCDPITFTQVPQTPEVTATQTVGVNAPQSDTEVGTTSGIVDLNPIASIETNTPIVLDGSCSPSGNNVTVSIADATPNSISGCTCSNGTFTCPSTTFTSLPETVTLVATGDLGGSDTETVTSNSQIDLDAIGSVEIGAPETFSGTCSPNGTGNISITLESGFIPSSVPNCDCSNGSFSCDPITFTQVPETPQVTATQNLGINAPQSDSETGTTTASLDLNPVASIEINTPIVLDGTCSPEGNDVTVSIADATPNTISGCTCSSGTFTCPSTTFTSLPETVTLVATGDLGGSDTETVLSNSQIDLDAIGSVDPTMPVIFSGSCSPNGTGNIEITLENGFMPSTVPNCDCSNGSFVCNSVTFTSMPQDGEVTATQILGVNAPQSDTEMISVMPKIDLNSVGEITIGSPIQLSGTCYSNSNNVSISITNGTPNTISGCTCSSGTFTCPSTTFTSLPEHVTLVATGSEGGSDTENATVKSEIDLMTPTNLVVGNNNFSGTCSPNKTGSITITVSGATPNSFSPCDCVNSSFSCSRNITALPNTSTTTITANNSAGSSAPSSDSITVTLNTPPYLSSAIEQLSGFPKPDPRPTSSTGDLNITCSSSECWHKSKYMESGIRADGTHGTIGNAPVGYVYQNRRLSVIGNRNKNNFADFDGDFFLPGRPEEGYGVEFGNNSSTRRGNNSRSALFQIPGSITGTNFTTFRNGEEAANIIWEGTLNGFEYKMINSVVENGLYVYKEFTIKNVSGSNVSTDIYWYQNADPDNNQSQGQPFSTTNKIEKQFPASDAAWVSAKQADGSSMSLFSLNKDARVTHGGFTNRSAYGIWNGVGLNTTGTLTEDRAISIAFKITGGLQDNESRTFRYMYVINPIITDAENVLKDYQKDIKVDLTKHFDDDDADDDPTTLIYSATQTGSSTLPAWLTLNGAILEGTFPSGTTSISVDITATDSNGASSTTETVIFMK